MIYFDRIEVVNILAPNAVYDMVSYFYKFNYFTEIIFIGFLKELLFIFAGQKLHC